MAINENWEYREFTVSDFQLEEREGGVKLMRGYAALFNELSQDLGGFREQIAPGAFTEAIQRDDIRALFNHDPNLVLGRNRAGTLKLSEDQRGLAIEITPPDTQFARDLMVSMKRGDINQMSFAFRVMPNGQDWAKDDNGQVVRTIKRAQLFDVSPVTYPAYTGTSIAMRSFNEFKQTQEEVPSFDQYRIDLARRRLDLLGE